jgi:hypothetical protein
LWLVHSLLVCFARVHDTVQAVACLPPPPPACARCTTTPRSMLGVMGPSWQRSYSAT